MSGTPGSGKSTLCNVLSERLGWGIFSIGDQYREKHVRWQSETGNRDTGFEDYWSQVVTQEDVFGINETARGLLEKGKIIVGSRYAAFNAKGIDSAFKLFVSAPLSIRAVRAREIGKYGGKGLGEIERMLNSREAEEIRRGNESYGECFEGGRFDFTDGGHYDLVLDSSELSVSEEVDRVFEFVKSGR